MKTGFLHTIASLVALVTLLATPLLALAEDEIVIGLGETSYGWGDFHQGDHNHIAWRRLPWDWYNNTSNCKGETRPATGNVDGGGQTETIFGLEDCGNGWFEIADDTGGGYDHLAWRQVPWTAYNNCNGETWPASGRLDTSRNDQIVIGLGSCANGWFAIFYDSAGGYNHRAWRQVPWADYNSRNGETRPAVGDLDGGGEAEIVIGLGRTGYGWFEIRNGASGSYNHLAWRQVPWTSYNENCGGTRPALGDVDNDGRDEIVVGLDYPCNDGWFAIFEDATTNYAFSRWGRVNWTAYNNCSGETRPAVGDIDGGGFEEIVIGLGPRRLDCGGFFYPNGWYEVFDDASNGYAHKDWVQVHWADYNSRNGETWPAVGDTAIAAAVASEETEVSAAKVVTAEPTSNEPRIFPAILPGPPLDEINASAMTGPVAEAAYYAGPEAVALDPALAPVASDTFYAGPPQDNVYYAGPVIVEMANKLYLPVVVAE